MQSPALQARSQTRDPGPEEPGFVLSLESTPPGAFASASSRCSDSGWSRQLRLYVTGRHDGASRPT